MKLKKDELIDMLVLHAPAQNPSFLAGILDVDAGGKRDMGGGGGQSVRRAGEVGDSDEKEAGAPPPLSKKKRTTELSRLNWGKEEEGEEVRIGSEGQGVIHVEIMHKGSCKKVSGQVDWKESFGASGLLEQSLRVWGGGVSAQVLSLRVDLVQNYKY